MRQIALRRKVQKTRNQFMESLATKHGIEIKASAYAQALNTYREFIFRDVIPATKAPAATDPAGHAGVLIRYCSKLVQLN
jgi:hypothetical protein